MTAMTTLLECGKDLIDAEVREPLDWGNLCRCMDYPMRRQLEELGLDAQDDDLDRALHSCVLNVLMNDLEEIGFAIHAPPPR